MIYFGLKMPSKRLGIFLLLSIIKLEVQMACINTAVCWRLRRQTVHVHFRKNKGSKCRTVWTVDDTVVFQSYKNFQTGVVGFEMWTSGGTEVVRTIHIAHQEIRKITNADGQAIWK